MRNQGNRAKTATTGGQENNAGYQSLISDMFPVIVQKQESVYGTVGVSQCKGCFLGRTDPSNSVPSETRPDSFMLSVHPASLRCEYIWQYECVIH